MDKYIIDKKSTASEYTEGVKGKKDINFPLCMSVRFKDSISKDCSDFMLNTTRGKLFIPTDSPYPVGSKLALNFYIPPNSKFLTEMTGRVTDTGSINNVSGNLVKISDFWHTKLTRLEDYLEEKQHLVDETV
jgi:Tfp pilus assembly protein PilZ